MSHELALKKLFFVENPPTISGENLKVPPPIHPHANPTPRNKTLIKDERWCNNPLSIKEICWVSQPEKTPHHLEIPSVQGTLVRLWTSLGR